MSFFHRHRGLTPYLLLAPGLAWLAVFFIAPLGFLGYQSLQSGSFDFGYEFTWAWDNYRDAISTYHEHLIRSFVYAGLATLIALADQLPARLLDRVPRRTVEEPLPARDHRPVLRHLPDPHARVADDPLRQRLRRRHAPHAARARRGRTAARDVDRRRRGAHLQLPALHGAAALRGARADRPAADRGRAGPLREQAPGVPARDAAALAARRLRGHPADVHPRRRRLHQRAAARDAAGST